VLVVEDDEVVRRFTVAALRRMGFTVLEARDGVEAVGIFRLHHHEIRLVLCDLDMPRLDGWGTLTALRRIKPGVRVVMASGYGQAEAMAENHPELPNAYLEKPYLWSQLADMVLDQLPSTAS
jgi:CheY-like chemotaxis protein